MRGFSKFRLLAATAFSLVLLNSLGIELQEAVTGQGLLFQGDRAEARSSGGRSRGGSFNRRPSGGGSSGGSSGSSGGSSGGSGSFGGGGYSEPSYRRDPYYNDRPYSNPGPVIVPLPGGYGGGYVSTGGNGFGLLVFLLIFLLFPIAAMYLMRAGRSRTGGNGATPSGVNRELANDIVTVTKLQIVLMAQARYIQESLTELTLNSDTETPEGLTEMLRETVLALLRAPENWTHVRATSETVKSREAAGQLFEKISIEERSKFSAETLAKVGGRLRRQEIHLTDEGPASFIVVTLLVGTEDDRPIIPNSIHSSQELQAALQRIGAITPDYLLIYELLWSPQDASDSLTYDELLSEYPDLVQI